MQLSTVHKFAFILIFRPFGECNTATLATLTGYLREEEKTTRTKALYEYLANNEIGNESNIDLLFHFPIYFFFVRIILSIYTKHKKK